MSRMTGIYKCLSVNCDLLDFRLNFLSSWGFPYTRNPDLVYMPHPLFIPLATCPLPIPPPRVQALCGRILVCPTPLSPMALLSPRHSVGNSHTLANKAEEMKFSRYSTRYILSTYKMLINGTLFIYLFDFFF